MVMRSVSVIQSAACGRNRLWGSSKGLSMPSPLQRVCGEAMNGLLQQAKRAARGFRTTANFIAIAYLRMSKLKHLPTSPFVPAAAK